MSIWPFEAELLMSPPALIWASTVIISETSHSIKPVQLITPPAGALSPMGKKTPFFLKKKYPALAKLKTPDSR